MLLVIELVDPGLGEFLVLVYLLQLGVGLGLGGVVANDYPAHILIYINARGGVTLGLQLLDELLGSLLADLAGNDDAVGGAGGNSRRR